MINVQKARSNFGLASNMTLLLWCVCGGFLLHMLESNYLTMLLKPNYEKPVDTAEDVIDRELTIFSSPGIETKIETQKNSPYRVTREHAKRTIVPKVIFWYKKKY